MAVLFSAVTLTADNNQVEFLAAGIPRDSDDLEGWTAYENFMDELDSEQEVSVHVEAYLYTQVLLRLQRETLSCGICIRYSSQTERTQCH